MHRITRAPKPTPTPTLVDPIDQNAAFAAHLVQRYGITSREAVGRVTSWRLMNNLADHFGIK